MDWFVFTLIAMACLAGAAMAGQRLRDPRMANLLLLGMSLRVVGSTARLEVLDRVYSNVGDASVYFSQASLLAPLIADLDFSFVLQPPFGAESLWGTHFIRTVTTFVVFLIGENIRATFLVFSIFSFLGLALIVRAYAIAAPHRNGPRYAAWVWLLPSLWFWPCSIGKEALMMLGVGLLVRGYVGSGQRPHWVTLVAGVVLLTAIRPHVAAIAAGALVVAEFLKRGRGQSPAVWLLGGGLVLGAVMIGLGGLGMADADLEGIEEQIVFRAGQTERGGSQIGRATGLAAIPMAFVNVLFRPFPGEAGFLGLLSGLELWFMWAVVLAGRRHLAVALLGWRSDRILALALPFTGTLTLLYGLAFANLGIIARQRALILPFLVILPALAAAGAAGLRPAADPAGRSVVRRPEQ